MSRPSLDRFQPGRPEHFISDGSTFTTELSNPSGIKLLSCGDGSSQSRPNAAADRTRTAAGNSNQICGAFEAVAGEFFDMAAEHLDIAFGRGGDGRVLALGVPNEVLDGAHLSKLYGVGIEIERTSSGRKVGVPIAL